MTKDPDRERQFNLFPLNGLACSVCGEPQRDTSGGASCSNGHGGAPGVEIQGDAHVENDDRLVLLDLETSGLDTSDWILEVGAVVVTRDLEPVMASNGWESEGLFFRRMPQHHADITEILSVAHPKVRTMHQESGLVADSMKDRNHEAAIGLGGVEDELISWLRDGHGFKERSVVLCGYSIHWDRSVLAAQMPAFAKLLHHRMLDVSAIREAYLRWVDPDFSVRWKEQHKVQHRVIDDIRMSLKELAFFRDRCFRGTGPPEAER
jgi:oligoribonuclease